MTEPNEPPGLLDPKIRRRPDRKPQDVSAAPFGHRPIGPEAERKGFGSAAPSAPPVPATAGAEEPDDRPLLLRWAGVLGGAVALGLNHALAVFSGKVYMQLVLLGSIAIGFGLLAALDRNAADVLQRREKADLRTSLKIVAALVASLALFVWLWVFLYGVEGTEGFRRWLGGD